MDTYWISHYRNVKCTSSCTKNVFTINIDSKVTYPHLWTFMKLVTRIDLMLHCIGSQGTKFDICGFIGFCGPNDATLWTLRLTNIAATKNGTYPLSKEALNFIWRILCSGLIIHVWAFVSNSSSIAYLMPLPHTAAHWKARQICHAGWQGNHPAFPNGLTAVI